MKMTVGEIRRMVADWCREALPGAGVRWPDGQLMSWAECLEGLPFADDGVEVEIVEHGIDAWTM